MMSNEERFWRFVDRNGPVPAHRPELGPCWEWLGFIKDTGYGQFTYEGRKQHGAHRVSWCLASGTWPRDCVLHHCDNRKCVRPDHLFVGSRADNMRDMNAKGRYRAGRKYRGEQHPNRVLTDDLVRRIRLMRSQGIKFRVIASTLGLQLGTTKWATYGWKHVA